MGLAKSPPPAATAGTLALAPRGSGTALGEPGREARCPHCWDLFALNKGLINNIHHSHQEVSAGPVGVVHEVLQEPFLTSSMASLFLAPSATTDGSFPPPSLFPEGWPVMGSNLFSPFNLHSMGRKK